MSNILAKQTDNELGEIVFKRSTRAKRMNIRVLSDRLEVALPYGFTTEDGIKFVNSVREKLLTKQKAVPQQSIVINESTSLQTLTFLVKARNTAREDIFFSMKSGILTIEFSQELDANDAQTQAYFWNGINYFLRQEAKRILPYRTYELAKKHNFTYSQVKIQSSRTRWGSCNQKKTINLSFYLLLLPQHLVDYVILHELCHTKEMNHSPRFWEWMDKVTDGKSKELRKELKNYRTTSYP